MLIYSCSLFPIPIWMTLLHNDFSNVHDSFYKLFGVCLTEVLVPLNTEVPLYVPGLAESTPQSLESPGTSWQGHSYPSC